MESNLQPLFDLMNDEHNLTLIESEMIDICVVAEKCVFAMHDPEAPEKPGPSGSNESPGYVHKDHVAAHDIIWGALVDAEAPLTDALKWAMDYLKPSETSEPEDNCR